MLPVIAHNLLESIELMASMSNVLADKAIAGFEVNTEHIAELVEKNPIMVTALNPVIGYELGAKIAKQAYADGRKVKEVALELTELAEEDLERILDLASLADPGIRARPFFINNATFGGGRAVGNVLDRRSQSCERPAWRPSFGERLRRPGWSVRAGGLGPIPATGRSTSRRRLRRFENGQPHADVGPLPSGDSTRSSRCARARLPARSPGQLAAAGQPRT